jgi:hypothetical protein
MARVTVAATEPVGVTAGRAISFTAADASLFNQTLWHRNLEIIAWNDGASGRTVTIESAPDVPQGRLADITAEAIAAHEIRRFGPFPRNGWRQSNGMLYLKASHADVKFAAVKRGR